MTIVISDPTNLTGVEFALIQEISDNLSEYAIGGSFANIENARIAMDVLCHYVYETQNSPCTHDGDGEILNHGRCVS